jgi:nucleoside-diphosphate-sugar epimerase
MIVTITGASGFVGQHLVPYLLERDKSITSLSLRNDLKKDAFDHSDAVVHLAGLAHDLKQTQDAVAYDKVNTDLTIALFNQFLINKNTKVFIFVSSIKALIDHADDPLTEVMEPMPTTPYGKSKQKAEAYLLAHLPSDKTVIILRPSMIHGPGNKGNLNLLYHLVRRGIPWPLGAFHNERSFLSVENICFAINELLDRPIPSGVYHIADSQAVSTNALIQYIGSSLHRKVAVWNIPKPLIKTLARLGDRFKLPFNHERLEKLTENYVVSNRKLVQAIGQELPIQALEGLKTTFESFK